MGRGNRGIRESLIMDKKLSKMNTMGVLYGKR